MQFTQLGRSGLTVSRICLGTLTFGDPAWRSWTLGEDAARSFFRRALEAGVNFFDTADAYSMGASEEVTGNLLREMSPLCLAEGLGIIPFSPLARGFLARRPGKPETARAAADPLLHERYGRAAGDDEVLDALWRVADARGCSAAEVALAWLLGRPGVVAPIVGASRMEHLDAALRAVELTLTEEECRALEAPYRPRAVQH